jgi:PAS domain S-box-containing protein
MLLRMIKIPQQHLMGVENSNKIPVTLPKRKKPSVQRIALILGVYLLIFLGLDWLSHSLEILPGVVAWYPPDGVSLALLLTFGASFTPGLMLASLISGFFIYQIQLPPFELIVWSIVLPSIYGAAVLFLRTHVRIDPQLRTLRDVLWLILSSAVISAILAVISVSTETNSGLVPIPEQITATYQWWIGEMIGIIVVAPLLLIHVMPHVKRFVDGDFILFRRSILFKRPGIKSIGQALSIPAALYFVFGVKSLQPLEPIYLIALPLLWIALDQGLTGISLGIPAINFGATFVLWILDTNPAQLGELQLFMLVIFITTLLIGVARTERIEAVEEIEGNEKRFRALIENNADAITLLDAKGLTIYDSPAAPGMMGYAPGELIGSSAFDLVYPDDLPMVRDLFSQLVKTPGAHERTTFRSYRKDGSLMWLEVIATNLLHEPSVKGVVVNYRDITDRKQAEERLAEERNLLRTLIDNLPDRIYVMDTEGRKTLSNRADWQASGGKKMEDVIGKTDLETYPIELAREYWALDKATLDSGNPVINLEERGLDAEGKLASVLTTKVPIRDEQGNIVGLVGIGRDITERKKAEEVLANERNLLRTLIDNLPDTIFIKDTESRIITDNSAHRRLLRAASPEDVIGKTDFDFFPRELATAFNNYEKKLFQSGEALINHEEPLIDIDGSKIWLQTTKVPIRDQQGIITGLVGINHDITENKKREERIRRQVAHLRALSDIDRAITASFGIEISLGTVLTHVTEQLSVDAAAILLYNQATNTLKFTSGRGFRTKAFEKAKVLSIGEGYAGQAILERRTMHISDLSQRTDNARLQKAIPGEGFVSYFCVPLIAKGNIKGALEIFHRSVLEPDEEWLDFLQTLAGQAALAIDNATLFDGMQRSNVELTLAYDATIEGWSRALDLRDKETEGHTKRVTEITLRLAQLFGMNDRELVQIRRGALLHDIGKLGVPDGILLKPGSLSDEEWIVMRKHPQFAFDMLAPIQYLKPALDIPYCHHEKWDGTGYPRGLKGDQIPLTARIFAIVDVWDALTSDRPYRPAWPEEKVLAHIRSLSGTHFDPQVNKVCLESGLLNSHK